MFLLMLFFDLLIGVDMICTTLKKNLFLELLESVGKNDCAIPMGCPNSFSRRKPKKVTQIFFFREGKEASFGVSSALCSVSVMTLRIESIQ
jgi:hypothetical protein